MRSSPRAQDACFSWCGAGQRRSDRVSSAWPRSSAERRCSHPRPNRHRACKSPGQADQTGDHHGAPSPSLDDGHRSMPRSCCQIDLTVGCYTAGKFRQASSRRRAARPIDRPSSSARLRDRGVCSGKTAGRAKQELEYRLRLPQGLRFDDRGRPGRRFSEPRQGQWGHAQRRFEYAIRFGGSFAQCRIYSRYLALQIQQDLIASSHRDRSTPRDRPDARSAAGPTPKESPSSPRP